MSSEFTALKFYFLVTASVVHLLQTYYDLKKMYIDQRLDAFMIATVFAMVWLNPSIYQLVLLIIAVVVAVSMRFARSLGSGDAEIVFWNILGLGQLKVLQVYFIALVTLTVLAVCISRKIGDKIPFTPVLAIAYFTTVMVMLKD